ncbi:hypothetical protein Neosp_001420 [[Neocosmospora] mangrovei]
MSNRGTKRTADMISDASKSPERYMESALDDLPPLHVLLKALEPGVSIYADSPNLNAPGNTDALIPLDGGSCSFVFHKPGQTFVVKKLLPRFEIDNRELAELAETEARQTNAVFELFNNRKSKSGFSIKFPGNAKCIKNCWVLRDSHKDILPSPWYFPAPALKMDMIYPLPKAVGRALIHQFYPKRPDSIMDPYVVEEILNQHVNQHCLVQPCLGLDVRTGKPGDFKLNNFELSLVNMQSIGINVVGLAEAIGEAPGLLHYSHGLCCDGIKFAFGTALDHKQRLGESYIVNLYVFDFGDCVEIDASGGTDEHSLVMADAMLHPTTRKFIPGPLKSPALYKVFKDAYLGHAAGAILDESRLFPYNVMKHYERLTAREFL